MSFASLVVVQPSLMDRTASTGGGLRLASAVGRSISGLGRGVNGDSDWDSLVVSKARPFPVALSKDVMVECHWCEATDATLSSFGMFAATLPAGTVRMKGCNLGYRV